MPEEIADVFAAARSTGLKVHCHAGETTNSSHALRIIEHLRPDRIAHGVLLSDWIIAQGSASPPVDICLTSNIALKVINSLEAHPLRVWWNAGVPICLSTDDPAIFSTTLRKEYELARAICPEISQNNDVIRTYWLHAATDPQALAKALKLDQMGKTRITCP